MPIDQLIGLSEQCVTEAVKNWPLFLVPSVLFIASEAIGMNAKLKSNSVTQAILALLKTSLKSIMEFIQSKRK